MHDHHGGNGFTGHKICGGYGSPVVASGRVYIAWWEPSGELIDSNAVAKADNKRPEKWLVTADEILACMDARTGRTLWQTRMAGTGWNQQYNNHCAIYQPVVACNDQQGGLVGFSIETGKELWRVPNCSPTLGSPIVWTVEGTASPERSFISAGPPRVVCVRPEDGEVLWQIDPPAPDADPLVEGEKPKGFYTTGSLMSSLAGDGALFSGGTMKKISSARREVGQAPRPHGHVHPQFLRRRFPLHARGGRRVQGRREPTRPPLQGRRALL